MVMAATTVMNMTGDNDEDHDIVKMIVTVVVAIVRITLHTTWMLLTIATSYVAIYFLGSPWYLYTV